MLPKLLRIGYFHKGPTQLKSASKRMMMLLIGNANLNLIPENPKGPHFWEPFGFFGVSIKPEFLGRGWPHLLIKD